MPATISRREGETLTIGGVAVAVAIARDKSATLVIAMYDEDGLLEGPAECAARAAAYRDEYEGRPSRRTAYRQRRSEPP